MQIRIEITSKSNRLCLFQGSLSKISWNLSTANFSNLARRQTNRDLHPSKLLQDGRSIYNTVPQAAVCAAFTCTAAQNFLYKIKCWRWNFVRQYHLQVLVPGSCRVVCSASPDSAVQRTRIDWIRQTGTVSGEVSPEADRRAVSLPAQRSAHVEPTPTIKWRSTTIKHAGDRWYMSERYAFLNESRAHTGQAKTHETYKCEVKFHEFFGVKYFMK